MKIDDNNKKTEEGVTSWQIEAERLDEIAALNYLLEKNVNDRALLENHFAKSSDIVPFLNMIEKLGKDVGAFVSVDSVDTGIKNTGLLVGLKVNGNFEVIYKFLTLLENSPYEFDFLEMNIRNILPITTDKVVDILKWEATFKIKLLSFIP